MSWRDLMAAGRGQRIIESNNSNNRKNAVNAVSYGNSAIFANIATPTPVFHAPDYPGLLQVENHAERNLRVDTKLTSEEWLSADMKERFEERAAIMEYDGGLSRKDAEAQAQRETKPDTTGIQP